MRSSPARIVSQESSLSRKRRLSRRLEDDGGGEPAVAHAGRSEDAVPARAAPACAVPACLASVRAAAVCAAESVWLAGSTSVARSACAPEGGDPTEPARASPAAGPPAVVGSSCGRHDQATRNTARQPSQNDSRLRVARRARREPWVSSFITPPEGKLRDPRSREGSRGSKRGISPRHVKTGSEPRSSSLSRGPTRERAGHVSPRFSTVSRAIAQCVDCRSIACTRRAIGQCARLIQPCAARNKGAVRTPPGRRSPSTESAEPSAREDARSRLEGLVLGATLVAFGVFAWWAGAQFAERGLFDHQHNQFFDADPNRVIYNSTSFDGPYQRARTHPLHVLLIAPIGHVLTRLLGSPADAVLAVTAVFAGGVLWNVNHILRVQLRLGRGDRALLLGLLGASASQVTFTMVPDTHILSAFGLSGLARSLGSMDLAALRRSRGIAPWLRGGGAKLLAWGGFAVGMLVTNVLLVAWLCYLLWPRGEGERWRAVGFAGLGAASVLVLVGGLHVLQAVAWPPARSEAEAARDDAALE